MKQFKIYQNEFNQIKAVKIGWSWPAFFFEFFWVLFKQMWKLALAIFVLLFLLIYILMHNNLIPAEAFMKTVQLTPTQENYMLLLNIISIGIRLSLAFKGNAIFELHLQSKKYKYIKTIEANSVYQAYKLFNESNQQNRQQNNFDDQNSNNNMMSKDF